VKRTGSRNETAVSRSNPHDHWLAAFAESWRSNLLIDCELFHRVKALRLCNWNPLPFPAERIDAVVLTRAHFDRSGYRPRLIRCIPPMKRRAAAAVSRQAEHIVRLRSRARPCEHEFAAFDVLHKTVSIDFQSIRGERL
jgi:phosphoribosyl 1,2-cyclic phosphodiesterase